ncbi:MAG: HIT family protein [Chlamydiales bacterium]
MRLLIAIGFFALILFNIDVADAKPCAFCRQEIIENQCVFQGEYLSILVDYAPKVKGHLLVIPKRHLVKAHELSKEEWTELSIILPKVVQAFSAVLDTDQYIILEKNGFRAFQDVPHVHFHLLLVTSQTWAEIFGTIPKQLSREELERETALFRLYFSS